MIAIGLNVVVGQAGLLELGYAGFYAVGAYTVALLTSPSSPWNQTASGGGSPKLGLAGRPPDRGGHHRVVRADLGSPTSGYAGTTWLS